MYNSEYIITKHNKFYLKKFELSKLYMILNAHFYKFYIHNSLINFNLFAQKIK